MDPAALSADLLAGAGLLELTRKSVTFVMPLPDPGALWRWLSIQGLAEAVAALPQERAEEFRARFFTAARHAQANGGIAPEFVSAS